MKKFVLTSFFKLADYISRLSSGRLLLAWLSTCLATHYTNRKVVIFYSAGAWFRLDGQIFIALGRVLRLRRNTICRWKTGGRDVFDERQGWWFLHYRPSLGDIIIDVGAGMGEDSYVFSQGVGPSGHVMAIEAHPETYRVLESFIKCNNLINVCPHLFAASNQSGFVQISSPLDADWQLSTIVNSHHNSDGLRVPCRRLDDIVDFAHSIISFMKINIEGAEYMALEGAPRLLARTQNICVCCHDFLGPNTKTKDAVCRLLDQAGFSLFFTSPDSPPYQRDFVYGKKRL